MAKKSMIAKANRTPKFSTRKVNRCKVCEDPEGTCGNSRCAESAFVS